MWQIIVIENNSKQSSVYKRGRNLNIITYKESE